MIIDQFFNWNKSKGKKGEASLKISERPLRSIIKSISWRCVGTMDTIVISWIITGKISMALTIGSIEIITKMILYFFHERIWIAIKWGKR